jgi:hypothetical protein
MHAAFLEIRGMRVASGATDQLILYSARVHAPTSHPTVLAFVVIRWDLIELRFRV